MKELTEQQGWLPHVQTVYLLDQDRVQSSPSLLHHMSLNTTAYNDNMSL